MISKWRCSVCGYIHEGSEPPEICPICGAGSDKFSPVEMPNVSLVREMLETFQPHAVAAHFPNALLPTAALFFIIALVLGRPSFETAAFYLFCMVVLTAPVTLITGLREWKIKFSGQTAAIFTRKKILGSTLIILSLVTAVLRYNHPEMVSDGHALKYLYFALVLAMLGCVVMLGHYGGKLVSILMNKE